MTYSEQHLAVFFGILHGITLKRINSNDIITLLKLKGENVMEAAFLLLLFVLEIAFSVYTIMDGRERAVWDQRRTLVRGMELISFFLFMLLPAVHFDFRFALCVSLLAIRFILALIFWMRRRNGESKVLKTGGILWRLAGSSALLFFAMVPAFVFTGYEGLDTTGEYQVKQVHAILVDESRAESFEEDGTKREVPIYIYYPDTEGGEFPLVVFSHGAFGYYQSNTSTYMELASNGYVVVSVEHPYHSFFTEDTGGKTVIVDMGFLKEVQCVNEDTASPDEAIEIYSKWLAIRTSDMNFAIDSIKSAKNGGGLSEEWYVKEAEDKDEILKVISMADTEKIGVIGHSLGGASSVELGRMRDDIDAVIDLDGTMLGEEKAWENGAFVFEEEPYPVPLLTIDNEEHHQTSVEYGTDYVNTAVLKNAKDGRNTYFKGSGHMNFTDLPLFSPLLAGLLGTGSIDSESCIRQTNEIIRQYYNCYLKGEGEITLQECYE